MSRHFTRTNLNRQLMLQAERRRQWMQHWLDEQQSPCKDGQQNKKRRLKELGV